MKLKNEVALIFRKGGIDIAIPKSLTKINPVPDYALIATSILLLCKRKDKKFEALINKTLKSILKEMGNEKW